MGLALLILILKSMALRTGNEHYNRAVRFWAKIFGINFALGVVTGIPMEFQFGTNWAAFSKAAGECDCPHHVTQVLARADGVCHNEKDEQAL